MQDGYICMHACNEFRDDGRLWSISSILNLGADQPGPSPSPNATPNPTPALWGARGQMG